MNEPREPRILDYGKGPRRRSPIPVIGIIGCASLIVAGVGIIFFGIWHFRSDRAVNKDLSPLITLAGTIVLGLLLIGLSARWLTGARRARREEKLENMPNKPVR